MVFRKKHIYSLIILMAIAAFVFYVSVVPKTFRHRVSIPFGMLKTGEQLYNPAYLVKWYVPFTQTDSHAFDSTTKNTISNGNYSLEINDQTLVGAVLKSRSGTNQKEFLFNVVPDTLSALESIVTLSYINTLFNEWFKRDELVKNALQSLANLKDYMEDTKRLYGYEIRITTVADTSFLFLSGTVPVAEKRAATKKLFEQLIAYADKKKAGYNGTRIFYSQKLDDEITLFASIGVSNFVLIDPGEPFEYKRMPYGKNLLEAAFQGPFGNVYKVYEALETFKTDRQLVSMAIPFQKFMSDGYDFSDSQVVQMKVYYPIF